MFSRFTPCAAAVLLGVAILPAQGAFVLLEDFEDITAGTSLKSGHGWTSNSGGGNAVVSNATSPYFDDSPDGQFALLSDTDQGTGGVGLAISTCSGLSFADGVLATYTFDAWIRTSNNRVNDWIIGLGTGNWTTSSRWRAAGITSAAGEDTLQFSILLNRSGAAQNYFNPVTSSTTALADDDMVIFAYNTVDDSVAQFNSFTGSVFGTGNPTTMWFYHSSNVNVEMGFDNLGYYANELSIVIPEPATRSRWAPWASRCSCLGGAARREPAPSPGPPRLSKLRQPGLAGRANRANSAMTARRGIKPVAGERLCLRSEPCCWT